MICPRTKGKCGYLAFCDVTGMCLDDEAVRENPLAQRPSTTADEFAAMVKDAKRLDWLEANSYSLPYEDHGAGPEIDLSRAAIDAAMEKE